MPIRIALGSQLSHCPSVFTLGVKANFDDYTAEEKALIREAGKVYFPTILYADAMHAMGKEIYPSIQSYHHLGDKIRQTHLFRLLDVPMPRTRLYYGSRRDEKILEDFTFPFVAKLPRGVSRGEGIYLIRNRNELAVYLDKTAVAYIQEYLQLKKDLRIVVLGGRVVHAYWRNAAPGDFRTNLSQGGRAGVGRVSGDALAFGVDVATRCGFNHVGLDVCHNKGEFFLLEANMKFGTVGFRTAGLNYKQILMTMIEKGEL